jgi:hypothetical protein
MVTGLMPVELARWQSAFVATDTYQTLIPPPALVRLSAQYAGPGAQTK